MKVPFSMFPEPVLEKASQLFLPWARRLDKMFPSLPLHLKQAGFNIEPNRYKAIMLFLSTFYLVFFSAIFSIILSKFTEHAIILGITIGLVVSFLVLIQLSMYPLMIIRKRERDIETNLLFGLRTMLIEIKSGVNLFEAMKLIAIGNYGNLSTEFKKAIDEIDTGAMYDDSLQQLATNNPSAYFRKAIWQIVDGMKAGGDIADIIKETVKSAARDQRLAINKYASQLRLLSLAYMMIGVIMPALLFTVLIVAGTQIDIPEAIFWVILGALVIMQFMYIGIMKSRRPTVMG